VAHHPATNAIQIKQLEFGGVRRTSRAHRTPPMASPPPVPLFCVCGVLFFFFFFFLGRFSVFPVFICCISCFTLSYYFPVMKWFDLVEEILVTGGRSSTTPTQLSVVPSLQQSLKR
jgi:hypothetical protein